MYLVLQFSLNHLNHLNDRLWNLYLTSINVFQMVFQSSQYVLALFIICRHLFCAPIQMRSLHLHVCFIMRLCLLLRFNAS